MPRTQYILIRVFLSLFFLFFIVYSAISQNNLSKGLRGKVSDKISGYPLAGANIFISDSSKINGTTTNSEGHFLLNNVEVGRHKIVISFIGYKPQIVDVITHSAKETVIEVFLEESAITTNEITITGSREKDLPINKMSSVSARMFTIEETNRYAGSMNDPGRMAQNFAGVCGSDVTRNDIVIRGNSPSWLLWRLEDIEIPNPNHLASQGTTGGPISMLNNNTLSNSDFFSGAFTAEYSNALSGVFDLKMKTGNNEKHEYTAQFSTNGLELGIEGPFTRQKKSSFVFHYRYANYTFVDKIVNLKISGVPSFQDLSFKLNFPLGKTTISLFAIGGNSLIAMLHKNSSAGDYTFSSSKRNLYFGSGMIAGGFTANTIFNQKTAGKFILASTIQNYSFRIDTLDHLNNEAENYNNNSYESRITAKYILSKKFTSKISSKSGLSAEKLMFNLQTKYFNWNRKETEFLINESANLSKGPLLLNAFSHWLFKPSDKLNLSVGLNNMYLTLSNSYSPEPRAGASWEINNLSRISLGYGLHSHIQPLATYYTRTITADSMSIKTNSSLDFSKSHHIVAGYDIRLNENLRLKTEVYYQYIFNVPVESKASSFSTFNTNIQGDDVYALTTDSLVNNGTGRNYGLEITLERFFSNNYYWLFTASVFESKYSGSDKVERNSQFNNNYIVNILFGKEFKISDKWTIITDIKGSIAGGKRYTPIDVEKSIAFNSEVLNQNEAYSNQGPVYFKSDIKIGFRFEGKKVSQEFAFNADNFTNHKNIFRYSFNSQTKKVEEEYQFGIMPGIYYRIFF